MSPLRSSAGPAVCTNGTPSSAATICASYVLPRPGGPASRTWSSASPRAAAAAIETPSCSLQRLLPDELVQPLRAQRAVELVLRRALRRLERRRRACGCSPARAPCSAWAIRSSGVLPGRAVEQLLGLLRAEAEADQALARQQRAGRRRARRATGRSRGAAPTFSRSSTTIRSAVRLPTPGRPAGARVAGRHGGQQLARRAAGEHRQRHLRARRTGRRSAAGTDRAPPPWRSRRGAARRRAR